MRKNSNVFTGRTVGLDVGDHRSAVCVLSAAGEVIETSEISTTRKAIRSRFGVRDRMRVVLETGSHANWLDEELKLLGHEVIVANAREVRAISASNRKSDRSDAEKLARLGRADLELLHPVEVRSEDIRKDLLLVRARAVLVDQRTQLVNHVRGSVKSFGERMPDKSTVAFHKLPLPEELQDALSPVMKLLEFITQQIAAYDEEIGKLAGKYPQVLRLQQVSGVGPITAVTYVLTIVDPNRFKDSRNVGPYLGLTPRKHQSGKSDPQLCITKSGDTMMRTLLVQCAQYILRRSSPDTSLKRFGERLTKKGDKISKRKAVVATARKLSVLLLALWKSGEGYEPLRGNVSRAQRRRSRNLNVQGARTASSRPDL
jgi:transposase